jgi:hypothetical protein
MGLRVTEDFGIARKKTKEMSYYEIVRFVLVRRLALDCPLRSAAKTLPPAAMFSQLLIEATVTASVGKGDSMK